MEVNDFKKKLSKYSEKDIIIKKHTQEQAEFRQISLKEVKNNILHPDKLVFVEEQKGKTEQESKYNCYFAYSENYFHRYVIILDGKLLIVTIISINRRWQGAIESRR